MSGEAAPAQFSREPLRYSNYQQVTPNLIDHTEFPCLCYRMGLFEWPESDLDRHGGLRPMFGMPCCPKTNVYVSSWHPCRENYTPGEDMVEWDEALLCCPCLSWFGLRQLLRLGGCVTPATHWDGGSCFCYRYGKGA